MLIDVHCHLTGDGYDACGGVKGALDRARAAGVERIICCGFDLPSSIAGWKLAAREEDVYFCAGFQPEELDRYREGDLDEIARLCDDEKCVALGEIGLDYHFPDNPTKELQRELFVRQIALAHEKGLPVVVHSRDAAAETAEILRENADKGWLQKGGLLHCYSYSAEMTADFAAIGMYFSFGGTATFKNARKVHESVRRIPACRILTETDSPYLTPEPFRGQFPNEPCNVKYVLARLAQLRGENETELENTVADNARRLFFRLK